MEIKYNELIQGKGLYATKHYTKGSIIHILTGKVYDRPTRETIHIGNNIHVYDEYGIYINHSFSPSTYIDGINIVAIRDIHAGDEITFNYNISEITPTGKKNETKIY